MDRYYDFTVEDFVWDDFFRQWVLSPTRETDAVWQDWIDANPEMLDKLEQAKAIVLSLRWLHEPDISEPEITRIVKQTVGKIAEESAAESQPAPFYRTPWFRIAASVALLLIAAWTIYKSSPRNKTVATTVVEGPALTNQGFREKVNTGNSPLLITLEDGSKITLAPAGVIRYAEKLSKEKREVYLTGEAFFDIAKDADRPFFVYSNGLVTKVLGTSFTIRAYGNSNEVTVEVKTGRVSVFPESDPAAKEKLASSDLQGVVLRPNQKIIYSRENVRMVKTLVEKPEMVVAQAEKPMLEFEDTPASEVFETIAKAYGIDILFDEEVLKDCPLTATLDNQTLHEKLSIICKAVESSYEILDGQIVIHSKGCKN
jgi:transmembrane sensor